MDKQGTPPSLYRTKFLLIMDDYRDAVAIYTDGSKTDIGVGSAFVVNTKAYSWVLPTEASIYTAELYAIWQALWYCRMSTSNTKFIIMCDSISVILGVRQTFSADPLVQLVLANLYSLQEEHKTIIFLWIPSHVGIEGNELADTAAKGAATTLREADFQLVRPNDAKKFLKSQILDTWQNEWNDGSDKLKLVKQSTRPWKLITPLSRKERIVLTRLRIGHTYLTSSHLLRGEEPPYCNTCNVHVTVKHILEECTELIRARRRHGIEGTIAQILANSEERIKCVIGFLRELGLLHKL